MLFKSHLRNRVAFFVEENKSIRVSEIILVMEEQVPLLRGARGVLSNYAPNI